LTLLKEQNLPHKPLEVLFTTREETGLEGAKALDLSRLRAKTGIGLDSGGDQGTIIASAPAQNSLDATVYGRMAHAGANPEEGINAIRVAAEAIVQMPLGRIDHETTANIGVIEGGSATNIVPEMVTLRGEARSRNEAKLQAQTLAMTEALERSAEAHGARCEIEVRRMYDAYNYDESTPVIRMVSGAMRSVGIEPLLLPTGGGSDANVFNAGGMQVVQISGGMKKPHTREEYVALEDMLTATRVMLACIRS
ncbi:MAG: peptidase M20, partial [Chloroflexi bacterium RBG_13_56_8]